MFAFVLQMFGTIIILADYRLNTQSYATNCENKARPQMHCNGKCQMMKKIEQENKKDQQNPERKTSNRGEISFYLPSLFIAIDFFSFEVSTTKKEFSYVAGHGIERLSLIFHPPKFC